MGDSVFAEDISSAVSREECERLGELADDKIVLELGSWYGRSAVALGSVAKHLYAVDWHRGDPQSGQVNTLAGFMGNIDRYGLRDRTTVLVGRNEDALPALARGYFDLVFVDSFHTQAAVERDIELVLPLVKEGGVIAFHDYGLKLVGDKEIFGVTEAVDAFAQKRGLKVEVVRTLAVVRLEAPATSYEDLIAPSEGSDAVPVSPT